MPRYVHTLEKARHSRGRKEARAADPRGRQGFHARVRQFGANKGGRESKYFLAIKPVYGSGF